MANGDGLILGVPNASTQQTHLQCDGGTTTALSVANLNGGGIVGVSTSDGVGVEGASDSGTGVRGATNSGDGMLGITVGGGRSAGVRGNALASTGAGVIGEAGVGPGVLGLSALRGVAGGTPNGIGVSGYSGSADGVYGQSDGPAGFNAAGVRGVSIYGNGVIGSSAEGWAGLFVGPVYVDGDLVVTGTIGTTAAGRIAPAEKVGRADLVDGCATVPLEPDLAALAGTTDYHVFVTPEADCAGLYVSARGEDMFEVRELRRGCSSVPFSYRVVTARGNGLMRRTTPLTDGEAIVEPSSPRAAGGASFDLADLVRQHVVDPVEPDRAEDQAIHDE